MHSCKSAQSNAATMRVDHINRTGMLVSCRNRCNLSQNLVVRHSHPDNRTPSIEQGMLARRTFHWWNRQSCCVVDACERLQLATPTIYLPLQIQMHEEMRSRSKLE